MESVIDSWRGSFEWHVEKWSEDAVDFARRKLERADIRVVRAGDLIEEQPLFRRDEHGTFHYVGTTNVVVGPRFMPITEGIPSWLLRKLVGEPEECVDVVGNLLLNEGIQRLQDLSMIATVTSNQVAGNPWSNANAFLGVGASSTAEAATQTDLQTTPFYKAMNATFPSRTNQTVSFQSDFTTTEANIVWNEWSVAAGATTASGAGFTVGTTNLNRKVASLGTKASGTWTLTGQVTLS